MKRGDQIVVKDYKGQAHVRRVWSFGETHVYICTERQFQNLMGGFHDLPPIGFPFSDAYQYDDTVCDSNSNNTPHWWANLNPIVEKAVNE